MCTTRLSLTKQTRTRLNSAANASPTDTWWQDLRRHWPCPRTSSDRKYPHIIVVYTRRPLRAGHVVVDFVDDSVRSVRCGRRPLRCSSNGSRQQPVGRSRGRLPSVDPVPASGNPHDRSKAASVRKRFSKRFYTNLGHRLQNRLIPCFATIILLD